MTKAQQKAQPVQQPVPSSVETLPLRSPIVDAAIRFKLPMSTQDFGLLLRVRWFLKLFDVTACESGCVWLRLYDAHFFFRRERNRPRDFGVRWGSVFRNVFRGRLAIMTVCSRLPLLWLPTGTSRVERHSQIRKKMTKTFFLIFKQPSFHYYELSLKLIEVFMNADLEFSF